MNKETIRKASKCIRFLKEMWKIERNPETRKIIEGLMRSWMGVILSELNR